jgi:hypothetical protein
MWRKFCWRNGDGIGDPRATAYAADVLFASWVTAVDFTAVEAVARARQAPRGEDMPADAGAFLSRVYVNQEC